MKKFLIIVLLILVVLFGGLFLFLDKAIKSAVLTIGPEMLGTKVELESVNVSLLSGGFALKGFKIANPEGFDQTVPLAAIDDMRAGVGIFSLLSDTIVVKEFVLNGAQFSFEQKSVIGSKNNIGVLMDNISKYAGASEKKPAAAEEAKPAKQKKIILHYVKVAGIKVTVVVAGTAQSLTLPDIEIKNIGVAEGGVTPVQATTQITVQIFQGVLSGVFTSLKDGTLKGLSDVGKDARDGADNFIKGLFK